jgi:hypothetical protein
MPFATFPQNLKQQQDEKDSHRRDGGHSPHSRNDGNNYFNGHFKSILMPYPYTFICYQVDKYERLVEQSRSRNELDVRLDAWLMWKTMLINYSN